MLRQIHVAVQRRKDAPDAAELSRRIPGRGFLRLGSQELQEFQTACVSTPWLPNRATAIIMSATNWTDPLPLPPTGRDAKRYTNEERE